MYLREARRRNRDGSVVSYLQLAHKERHPETGAPAVKVIHSFGRAETVDRAGLARLVSSISRFLDPSRPSLLRPAPRPRCWTRGGWVGRGCLTGSGSG